jgi:hypothetical protein
LSVADDNTVVVRTDTARGYIWDSTFTDVVGNAGGAGGWRCILDAKTLAATELMVKGAQLFTQGVFALTVAPSDSSVIYACYAHYQTTTPIQTTVYKSVDGGRTFAETGFTPVNTTPTMNGNGQYRMWGQKLAVHPADPNIAYLGTGNSHLFATADGGATWRAVSGVPASLAHGSDYPGQTGIVFRPSQPTTIYVSSYGHGIYRSTDGGMNWANISGTGTSAGPSEASYADINASGNYVCVDLVGNCWTYISGVWTKVIPVVGSVVACSVAVDPFDANHIVVGGAQARLQESQDGGVTWSGWSARGAATYPDIPWLGVLGSSPRLYEIVFDRVTPNKLLVGGTNDVYDCVLTGPISIFTVPALISRGVGLEQLNANDICVPVSGSPILASWDHATQLPNLIHFPTTIGLNVGGQVCAAWSLDFAPGTRTVVCIADGFYIGTAQMSAISSDGGQTWSNFKDLPLTVPPVGSFGGYVAVSTPQNFVWARCNAQPYYTLDGGHMRVPGDRDH